MNTHILSQSLPQFQSQHIGQPRQGQQPAQNSSQARGIQTSQPSLDQYANYDPQIALWTVKKGKHLHWRDVKPQQQHVSFQSLQDELDQVRRGDVSVKRKLNQIPSESARDIVNDLVDEQNQILWRWNQNIQWTIAGIELDWKSLNRREQQLKSIDIILKTEQRGLSQDGIAGRAKNVIPRDAYDFQDPIRLGRLHGVSQDQQFHQVNNPVQNQGPNPKNTQNQGLNMGREQPLGRTMNIGRDQQIDLPQGRGPNIGRDQQFDQLQGRGPNVGRDPQFDQPQGRGPNIGRDQQSDQPQGRSQNVGRDQQFDQPQGRGTNIGRDQQFDQPQGRSTNVGRDQQFDQPQGRGPNIGRDQQFDHLQGRAHGQGQASNQGQGGLPPPPPPPPPNVSQHSLPPPPPPPPPPPVLLKQQQQPQHPQQPQQQQHQNPQQQQQQQQQQHQRQNSNPQQLQQHHNNIQNQARPMPGSFPEPSPHPSMRHEQPRFPQIDILTSHILKKQKSKSKGLRHDYLTQSSTESGSNSDSDVSDSIFTCTSSEDGAYGIVAGRSRSSGRKKSHSRSRKQSKSRSTRSPSRGRDSKAHHKDKTSRARNKINLDPPPMGKHSGKSTTNSSPRSSTNAIPAHQIHIHMNPTSSSPKDRSSDSDRGRESDRDRRTRNRKNSMHSSFEASPSNLQKLVTTHLGSPRSSSGHDSDTGSFGDGSSVYSVDGNESVFSEPMLPARHARGNHKSYPQSEVGAQIPHRSRTFQQRPREEAFQLHRELPGRSRSRYPADDYPHP
ncbi:hypothetical protein K505DRAFT_380493, partial [Melanomma pulvis-pyrius CBS 109.77]